MATRASRGRARAGMLVCAVAAFALSSCGGDDNEGTPALTPGGPLGEGGTLVWTVTDRVAEVDPLAARTRAAQLVTRQVHEPLVGSFSGPFEDTRRVPGLARSVRPNGDATIWTLRLRTGVRFQDGEPFNAEAVLANAERWLTTAAGRQLLPGLVDAFAPRFDVVRFILAAPDRSFGERLSSPQLGVVSPAALRPRSGVEADYAERAIGTGTGPFELRERSADRQLLARNTAWWGTASEVDLGPALEQAEFRAEPDVSVRLALLDAGEAQLADESRPRACGGRARRSAAERAARRRRHLARPRALGARNRIGPGDPLALGRMAEQRDGCRLSGAVRPPARVLRNNPPSAMAGASMVRGRARLGVEMSPAARTPSLEPLLAAAVPGEGRPARRGLVRRDRLIAKLDETKDTPVLLLVAPAGYGKTTALADWTEHDDRPSRLADARRAAQRPGPDAGRDRLASRPDRAHRRRGLRPARHPSQRRVERGRAAPLRRAARSPQPFVLVLDDLELHRRTRTASSPLADDRAVHPGRLPARRREPHGAVVAARPHARQPPARRGGAPTSW